MRVEINIKDNSNKINFKGKVSTLGQMEKDMKENIKKIKKMEKGLTIGQTTIGKKVSIRTKRTMVGLSITMQMEE